MPKRSFKVDDDDIAFLEKIRQENSLFSIDEAHSFVFKQLLKGKVSIDILEDPCKNCPKPHIVSSKGIICITKKAQDGQVSYRLMSFDIARACAEKPFNTPINRKTREMYEHKLQDLENQTVELLRNKDYIIYNLTEKLRPLQNIISEKDAFKSRVSEMRNTLLERDQKIASLETDNEQLRIQIEKLSENEVLKENDALRVELNQKTNLVNDYQLELKKLEALKEKERQTYNEAISQIQNALRDFNIYLPKSLEPYDVQQYIKAMQKKIEQLESYLHIIRS